MNARRVVVVSLLVVLVYGGIILWGDVQRLRAVLAGYAWWTFAASLALASTNYAIRWLKWEYYLARLGITDVPKGESAVIFLSAFVMSITPGKAGEVFKSALLASARGVPVAQSAPIVVAERLTDLLSLILIVAVGGFWFPDGRVYAALAAAMVAAVMLLVLHRPLGDFILVRVERTSFGARLGPRLREAYASLRVVASPSALVFPTALSVLAWGCECLGLWIILRGLGQTAGVAVSSFCYATATVAGAVAMLPGGVGGFEPVMLALLPKLAAGQVDLDAARAATILVRLATLWFAVAVGAVALGVFRRRYDRNRAAPTTT
jgi:uncharacterized protein (TIRG00374 family)